MMQQYEIAFSIFFKHEYFSDGNLRSLTAKPTPETALLLRKSGALLKPFQNGLHILYDSCAYGRERSRTEFLETAGYFKFLLLNSDTSFFNYTAGFNADMSRSYLYFSNTDDLTGAKKDTLQAGSFVGKDDLRQVDTKDTDFFIKPFGMIALQLHKDLAESITLSFASLSTYWCYILTKDYLQELVEPAVIHKVTKKAFMGPEKISLAKSKTALGFYSTTPLPCQERQQHTFQLVEEYHPERQSYRIVIPALPGADMRHISSIKTTAAYKDKNLSFIII